MSSPSSPSYYSKSAIHSRRRPSSSPKRMGPSCPSSPDVPSSPIMPSSPVAMKSSSEFLESEDVWVNAMLPVSKQPTHRKNDYATILSLLKNIDPNSSLIKNVDEAEVVERTIGSWFLVRGCERSVVKLGIGANPGLKKYYWRANSSKRLLKREMETGAEEASLVYIIQKATPVSKRCASIPDTDIWLVMYLPATLRAGPDSSVRKVVGPSRRIPGPSVSSALPEMPELIPVRKRARSSDDEDDSSSSSAPSSPCPSSPERPTNVTSPLPPSFLVSKTEAPVPVVVTQVPAPASPVSEKLTHSPKRHRSSSSGSSSSHHHKKAGPSHRSHSSGHHHHHHHHHHSSSSSSSNSNNTNSSSGSRSSSPVPAAAPVPLPASEAVPTFSAVATESNDSISFSSAAITDDLIQDNVSRSPADVPFFLDNFCDSDLALFASPDPYLPLAGSQTIFSAAIEAACMSGMTAPWMSSHCSRDTAFDLSEFVF